jgi:hypothetical protein
MAKDNMIKILLGQKTTTIRSQREFEKIGLEVGETGIWKLYGNDVYVHNKGLMNIEQAGGKEEILKSEGVKSENDFMYQQSRDFVNGKISLFVYTIKYTISC